ncbi:MAG TPA: GerMN domain-containing protein [Anaerolineales bacterium]
MTVNKLFLFLVLLLTACGTLEVTIEQTPTLLATATSFIPTDTSTVVITPTEQLAPTQTLIIPSATNSLPPPTPVPPTATTVPPNPTAAEQTVKIFLIALEDNGQSGTLVGCGDSAIPVTVTIPRTQGILRAALERLLSAKQQFYGESGFYNALYQSDLQLRSVRIDQAKAILHLTGTVMLGGVCDSPRVQAQIEQTALQFSTVTDVEVFLNDTPLEEVLSQQ